MEVFKVIREFRDDPRHAKETNHILFGTTTYYLVPVPTGSQACGAGIVLHKKPVLRICIWYIVRKTVLWIRNIFLSPNPDPIFLWVTLKIHYLTMLKILKIFLWLLKNIFQRK
jgi:hypothetical protein